MSRREFVFPLESSAVFFPEEKKEARLRFKKTENHIRKVRNMARILSAKEQVVLICDGLVSQQAIADFIGTSRSTVQTIRKEKLRRTKVRTSVHKDRYPWMFDENLFRDLGAEWVNHIRQIRWNQHLVAASDTLASKEHGDDDAPLHIGLHYYRCLLPLGVIAQLYGISEQTVERRADWMGIKLDKKTGAKIQSMLYRSDEFPQLPRLGQRQQEEVRRIITTIRREFHGRVENTSSKTRSTLLQTMKARKRELLRSDEVSLYTCRGDACRRTEWPRTEEFFFRATTAKDGLENKCKFCRSVQTSERPKRRAYSTGRTIMAATRSKELVTIMKEDGKEIPTMYLRELFNLSPTQFSRIRIEAKVERNISQSRTILWRWRFMDEEEFPELRSLSDDERKKLLEIWTKDKKQHEKDVSSYDATLLKMMNQRRTSALDADTGPELLLCNGTCGESWPSDDDLCFPMMSKDTRHKKCRRCINKERRKKI